jgi:hypothetical protein
MNLWKIEHMLVIISTVLFRMKNNYRKFNFQIFKKNIQIL